MSASVAFDAISFAGNSPAPKLTRTTSLQENRCDPIHYADLSADFSMLIARHCVNKTIHPFLVLIHNIRFAGHAVSDVGWAIKAF